jgi:hypothetical protein
MLGPGPVETISVADDVARFVFKPCVFASWVAVPAAAARFFGQLL